MTLTKEKNNTNKQHTLPNDERLFIGSNVHETDINGCQQKWHSLPIRRLIRHSCDQAFMDRGYLKAHHRSNMQPSSQNKGGAIVTSILCVKDNKPVLNPYSLRKGLHL